MSINLLKIAGEHLGEYALKAIGEKVGLDSGSLPGTVEKILPSLLGLFSQKAQSQGGAESLLELVKSADGSILDDTLGILKGDTADLQKGGLDALGSLFGGDSSSIVEKLAGFAGLSSEKAGGLLGILTPMLTGLIGKQVSSRGLGLADFQSMMKDQDQHISGVLGNGFMDKLGLGGLLAGAGAGVAGLSGIASGATDKISGLAGSATDAVTGAANAVGDKVSGVVGAAGDKVTGVVGAAGDKVTGVVGAAGDKVTGVVGAAGDKVSGAVTGLAGAATGGVKAAGGAVTGLAGAAAGGVKAAGCAVTDGAKATSCGAKKAGGGFLKWLPLLLLGLIGFFFLRGCKGGKGVTETLKDAGGAVTDSASSIGGAIGEGADAITDAAGGAVENVVNAPDAIAEGVDSAGEALGNGADALVDGAKSLGGIVTGGADSAGEALGNGADALVDGAKSLGGIVTGGAESAGDAIGDGAGALVDGVKSLGGIVTGGAESAGDAIGDGAGALVDGVKSLGGIVTGGAESAGDAIGNGAGALVDGIKSLGGKAADSAEALVDGASEAIGNEKVVATPAVSYDKPNLSERVKNLVNKLEGIEATDSDSLDSAYAELSSDGQSGFLYRIPFQTGETGVPTPHQEALSAKLKSATPGATLVTIGYADVRGDESANKRLSFGRAQKVGAWIKNSLGNKAPIESYSMGETERFSKDDFSKNRVVEVWQVNE